MDYSAFFLILNLFTFVYSQNYETGDNSTLYGCSNKCNLEDSTLACWNQTSEAFHHLLMNHLKFYVAVQTNIDQWHRRNDINYESNFTQLLAETNKSMQSFLQKDDILDASIISSLATSLIDAVEKKSTRIIDWYFHYSCPIPCSYFYDIYFFMFIASMFLNLIFFLAMFYEWFINDDDE